MPNDVKKKFIYITYKKYVDELNKSLPDEKRKYIKRCNILIGINIIMISIFMLIQIFDLFNPLNQIFLYGYLGVEIVILIWGWHVVLKVDKYICSDEGCKHKFHAINKVIPSNKYNAMKEILTIKESFSIYEYIKDFLIKVVGILSVAFGVIMPMIEQLIQPFLKELVRVSELLTKKPLHQLSLMVGIIAIVTVLILMSILFLWIGSVALIKLYDQSLKLFHLTSYSKGCELITTCELRKYYEENHKSNE